VFKNTYDKAGNLTREIEPDGTTNYTYSAQNKLVRGVKASGESSEYVYNALGVRIENVQVRTNKNAGNQNADLRDGSHGVDYMRFLKNGRASWQRVWETEIGTTVQSDKETVTRRYVVDYLSIANRDIFVTEDGSYTTRYVYDASGRRLSAEFDYAPGTKRGEAGENLQSDIAVEIGKVFYRTSILGSTLFAVDKNGEVIAHAIYDPWGKPLTETYTDSNYSGLENLNNFTGYTYDITLALYFAQNRFYDASIHRFTQEDTAKDGANWYVYCFNSPVLYIDYYGEDSYVFYDPFCFKDYDMEAQARLYASELTKITHTATHIIAMSTEAALRDAWNSMGEEGKKKIDAVVLFCHGNSRSIRIYTDPNSFIEGSKYTHVNIEPEFFYSGLTRQNITYFFTLGCLHGDSVYDTRAETNVAMTIFNSTCMTVDAVIASDRNVWHKNSSTVLSSAATKIEIEIVDGKKKFKVSKDYDNMGDGFKVYRRNKASSKPDIAYIGNSFLSFTELYNATEKVMPRRVGLISEAELSSAAHGEVSWKEINVRAAPGTAYDSIGMAHKGDTFLCYGSVCVGGKKEEWVRVSFLSGDMQGKSGYVAKKGVNVCE